MDFTDYMWGKLIVLCIVAFIINFWIGFTDRK
jgi:hypothetical protein